MYTCPNCGAGMRFDIAQQKLHCDFCDTAVDIAEDTGGLEAKEDQMDMTLFTCPQCGGEIYSMDNEAASFCTFCGASVLLEGRMASAKRPLHIIPFQKTREDCKKKYAALMKGAWFAPKQLRDPEFLERFRGIYLPFWTYHISQKGPVVLKGSRESGNYTEHLSMTCELDARYDGISYDASSAFSDELCRYITPFHQSSVKRFHPGYMSGFYADTADVKSGLYETDAKRGADEETFRQLKGEYATVSVEKPPNMSSAFHTRLEGADLAMYPVWFLTWRSGDRVAYAVMNGETGKLAADLPVDRKRFLLGSAALSLPLFLLLSFLPVITAPVMLLAALVLGGVTFILYQAGRSELKRRENRTDDRGFLSRADAGDGEETGRTGLAAREKKGAAAPRLGMLRSLPLIPGMIVGALILLAQPVSDIYYYAGALLLLLCILLTLTGLIGRFNLLTTRPIPEFHERGGEANG